ncbi:MAG: O-antigen ligase family protein [Acidobacteria bacterium]|nr:O-antigen ligase family protein [Acidobacteriota bacterium]
MTTTTLAAPHTPPGRLEWAALVALVCFVASLQVSIAAAGILLSITLAAWAAVVASGHERVEVPRMFWPLAAYAGATLVSVAFSRDSLTSLVDSKQLLLFLIVPVVYRLARGDRAAALTTVIITVGAISAVIGIVQYGVLQYDHLGRRPQGVLSHYMTYSGLLMLVSGVAAARLIYRTEDRLWPALVMPALLVALGLTFTRSAWVGACAAISLLLMLRDRRLLALVPVALALSIAFAPASVTDRIYSMFDLNDPSNRDRVAMMESGLSMVRDHPLTGLGPNMVEVAYPSYRTERAVNEFNPHLHNVPMHIAAERGLPALAIWCWFIATLAWDMVRRLRTSRQPAYAAAALAAVVSMLAAGFFEYNFGDSEFLMLFLVLITLPYAVEPDRPAPPA